MKKTGLLGAYKREKTMEGHELGKLFFKEEVWGNILYGKDNILVDYGFPVDKRGNIF